MPREVPGTRTGHRLVTIANGYDEDDTLALWRCNELLDSDDLTDEVGDYTLAPTADPVVVSGLFREGGLNDDLAREFDGSTQYFSATPTGSTKTALADALKSEWTVGAWLKPDVVTGTNPILVYEGPTDGTQSENILLLLWLNGDEVEVIWEQGSGTNVTSTTTGANLVAGRTYHLTVVKRLAASGTSGLYDVDIYVWDLAAGTVYSETFTDKTNADGGTAATMELRVGGRLRSAASRFDGTLDDIILSQVALTEEWARDAFARGKRGYSLEKLYDGLPRATHHRVRVKDSDGTWRDLSSQYGHNWCIDVARERDVDVDISTATVHLRRNVGKLSLSPEMQASPFNLDAAGSYNPLLDAKRHIKIETVDVPAGTPLEDIEEWEWTLWFEGFVSKVRYPSHTIELRVRDKGAILSDAFIMTIRAIAAGTAVETLMQDVVDDNEPPTYGYLGGTKPAMFTPTSPSWLIPAGVVANMRVNEAHESLAAQIGWNVRWVWSDARQAFRLTFFEVDRSKTTPDHTWDTSVLRDWEDIEIDEEAIRNKVTVIYGENSTTDELGNDTRTRVTNAVTAAITDSRNRYGLLEAMIQEAANSNINDAVEAQSLADAIASDLAFPKALGAVPAPHYPLVELGDLHRFSPDGLRFDANTDLAITGVRDTIGGGKATTNLMVRGAAPAGGHKRWLQMLVATGLGEGRDDNVGMPTPSNVVVTATVGGARVTWDIPTNRDGRQWDTTEVHIGTAPFTPDDTTLVAVPRSNRADLTGFEGGDGDDVVVQHRDRHRNTSAASSATAFEARYLLALPSVHAYRASTTQTLSSANNNERIDLNAESFDTRANFDVTTFEFTAPVTGVYRVSAIAELTSANTVANTPMRLQARDGAGTSILANGIGVLDRSDTPDTYYPELDREVHLTAGATLELHAVYDGGKHGNVTVAIGADVTRMSVSLVSQD